MSSPLEILNELRWKKFPVLNDGFVCLVDCMGDDSSVVQAARISYGEGTRRVSDDRTLSRYLMRHRHTTPFDMAALKFHVRVPMDGWRQCILHRTASVNEYATRYAVAVDSTQTTLPHEWRTQAEQNRQGSGAPLPDDLGKQLSEDEHHFQVTARHVYQKRLEAGVAREQARKDLPLSTFTEAYWKIDLHNLLHFLALRMDAHAQKEIRDYSATIGEKIVKPLFPVVWEAFEDYRLKGLFLSGLDVAVMQRLVTRPKPADARFGSEADFLAVQDESWRALTRSRERDECRAKLTDLGLLAPISPP